MMNEVSIDVSCSYQTNYVVEIATNVLAEDQSVDLDEHDGEFKFGIMVRTMYCKMGCVFTMVVVSILPHVEFGPNDHREEAPSLLYR